ncbi:MAG: CesT family type III secretion system chaperone [Chlamydiota bacterium]
MNFPELLQALAQHLNLPLKEDSQGSCSLLVEQTLLVQLEMSRDEAHLFFGARLGSLSPGRYREEMLELALRENGRSYPHLGILGYSTGANELAFFDALRLDIFPAEAISYAFQIFVEKALIWHRAIERGTYPEEITMPAQTDNFMVR